MNIRTTRLAALVAAVALGLTACGGGGATSEQSAPADTSSKLATQAQYNPQPRDNIKDGGSLTTALAEITPQFNTFQADGTLYTLILWRWYNPILAYFAPDGTYSPNPDYLTDVKKEEVDGNTVVTYTINPKPTYNDGAPIDWKSFEATWKANSGQNEAYLPSSTDGYSKIKSVTQGADERQAVVTFNGVYAWVDGLFNVLLNPKAVDPDVYNKGYVNNPRAEWGAGPYTIDEVDMKTGRVTFKRNEKWWGNPGKLDSRAFLALESSASINAFKNGQLDATSVASKDRLAQVKDMTGIEIRKSATPSQSLIVVNSGDPALKEANVRKAVFMGIDRSVLANIEFNGLDYTEEPPGSFALYPFQAGYVDNLTAAGYKFDAAAANALLDEAGWTKGADGIRAKGGEKFSIVYPIIGDDPISQAQAKAVNSMLKDIGIEVVLEQHPSSDFSKVFLSKKYGLFAMGFSSSDPFGFAYFCQLYCKNSSLNASGTGTDEIDKKIEELSKIGDPQQQIEAGNKLEQEIMAATWGIMPTTNGPTMTAVKQGLANYGASLFYVGPVQDIGWQK
jgi:peptide/nickel transport system substrate-binding protein